MSAALALAFALLGGCGGGGPTTTTISGHITLDTGLPPVREVAEVEPNDSIDTAQVLGPIPPGEVIRVSGHAKFGVGQDAFDGFRLTVPQRARIAATLEFGAGGGDLHLGVYDLTSLQYVESLTSGPSPKVAVVHAKGTIDLVVQAASGESDYVLTIVASTPASPIAHAAPSGGTSTAQFLGEVLDGDSFSILGTADALLDPVQSVLVAFPAAASLHVSLAFRTGTDFDVHVRDATTDLSAPTPLASFDTSDTNPETGVVDVAAGTLVRIDVAAFSGSGPWALDVSGAPPPTALTAPAALTPASGRRLGRWQAEALHAGVGPEVTAYGLPQREFVPGHVIVRFRDGAGGDSGPVAAGIAARACRVKRGARGAHTVLSCDTPSGGAPEDRARWTYARMTALKSWGAVAYAEPDWICHATGKPDDTEYPHQWSLAQIRAPEAWKITTGSASVIVAVIDTGRTSHPDLAGRQVGGYDMISDGAVAGDGDGFDSDPTDMGDRPNTSLKSTFHGSHVAGIIGAATDNGIGVTGVTWQTQIMHVRALGIGGGSDSDVADAILYAAGLANSSGHLPPRRADIINMSLGSPDFSQALQDACTAARAAGVVVFAAAGNVGNTAPFYPASNADVISVSAVDRQSNLTFYSTHGSTVDVCAPGGDSTKDLDGDGIPDGVISTIYDDSVTPAVPIYKLYMGTSMACPHAVGVAALMLSVNPTLTPTQLEGLLESTAQDLGPAGRDDSFGYGQVDAYAAVLAARDALGAPVLSMSSPSLDFGKKTATLDVDATNTGGGILEITSLTPVTVTGGPWLLATTFGPGNATRKESGVRIEVDRTGLADGDYTGHVAVASNGGSTDVSVTMTVQNHLVAGTMVHVRLLDPAGGTVAEAILDPAVTLDYAFDVPAAGSYRVVAGTDIGGDGSLCGADEWCGGYPVRGQEVPIPIAHGQHIAGIDLVVSPDAGAASASLWAAPRAR